MNTVLLVDDSDCKQRTAQHIFSKDGTTKSRKVTSIFARQSRGAIKFTQFATPLLRLCFNSSSRNFSHSFFFFFESLLVLKLKALNPNKRSKTIRLDLEKKKRPISVQETKKYATIQFK